MEGTLHNTEVVVVCQQEERIKGLETSQDKAWEAIKELSSNVSDVLFPSKLHPDNGIINQIKYMKDSLQKQSQDMSDLGITVKELTGAVTDLRTVVSGFKRYMEDMAEFKIKTETAIRLKETNDDRAEKLREKHQRTLQWVIGTAVVVILSLLTYIIAKP